MDGVKAFLNRRVARMPIWVWAIVAAIVLYAGYRYYKNKSGGSSTSSTDTSSVGVANSNGSLPNDVTGGGGITEPPIDTSGTVGSIPEGQLVSDIVSAIQDAIPQGDGTGSTPPETTPPDESGATLPGGTNVHLPGKSKGGTEKPKSKTTPAVKKRRKTTPKKPAHTPTNPRAKKPPTHEPHKPIPHKTNPPHVTKKPPSHPPEEPKKRVRK